ncbi:hypothetical protein OIU74_023781 [Salix koriyanagi]|uniref:Uncharacterized protein n=1 Tax=Salix koriyanagi TaxID=2511006 RepID=A0A9Q0WD14_9ROSI|nr:hypothetical protein OIU74_023781 [Salix koriyanagi]
MSAVEHLPCLFMMLRATSCQRLPAEKSEKLSKHYGRVAVDVYDVEKEIRYNMELVRKMNGRCNLEDWDQVTLTRNIQAGKGIGMSLVNGMFFRIFSDWL